MVDARIRVNPPYERGTPAELLVIVQSELTPLEVETRIRQIDNILRLVHAKSILLLVAAPWLSPRTRQKLREQDIAYLDLTGNASISIAYPSIRIQTQGASKDPNPPAGNAGSRNITLAGPRAGRVVRFLADFTPPYQPKEIAVATDVSLPWVSRLLGRLEDQLLIRRKGRTIIGVDWPELLRARAQTYDLLRANSYVGAVSLNGPRAVLAGLREVGASYRGSSRVAVTGSYAVDQVAPTTVGGQLMLYVDNGSDVSDDWLEELGLLRVDEGADVLLLSAHDQVVFERTRTDDGLTYVALTQLVLDGLAGPGRLPAGAERVLAHMMDREPEWRRTWSPNRG
ncbi:hypothetical protein A6A25_27850 [Saccharothrix sp. CB00851]|nr:hypothetical protein A6A25_27850 [Saccharothrix sp. CB00851]